jgi:hypothetical protein
VNCRHDAMTALWPAGSDTLYPGARTDRPRDGSAPRSGTEAGTSHAASLRVSLKRYTKQRGSLPWTTGTTRNTAYGITSSGLFYSALRTNFAPSLTPQRRRRRKRPGIILRQSSSSISSSSPIQFAGTNFARPRRIPSEPAHKAPILSLVVATNPVNRRPARQETTQDRRSSRYRRLYPGDGRALQLLWED